MAKLRPPEYWRPVRLTSGPSPVPAPAYCPQCGTQYALGARFCHLCGGRHAIHLQTREQRRWSDWLDLTRIGQVLELSTASLILVVIAAACALAAVFTGFVCESATLGEWQAIQTWRMQWLLATIAALLGAMLLRNSDKR